MKQLVDLGVEVRTGTRATISPKPGVQAGDQFIPCRVKIWAAGNNASLLVKRSHSGRSSRPRHVNDDLTIPDIGSRGDW